MESNVFRTRKMKNVGYVGSLSEGREGSDDDEARRDRRELEDFKVHVVSFTTNKTEQTRGGQKDMPMDVVHASGSEPKQED